MMRQGTAFSPGTAVIKRHALEHEIRHTRVLSVNQQHWPDGRGGYNKYEKVKSNNRIQQTKR